MSAEEFEIFLGGIEKEYDLGFLKDEEQDKEEKAHESTDRVFLCEPCGTTFQKAVQLYMRRRSWY